MTGGGRLKLVALYFPDVTFIALTWAGVGSAGARPSLKNEELGNISICLNGVTIFDAECWKTLKLLLECDWRRTRAKPVTVESTGKGFLLFRQDLEVLVLFREIFSSV